MNHILSMSEFDAKKGAGMKKFLPLKNPPLDLEFEFILLVAMNNGRKEPRGANKLVQLDVKGKTVQQKSKERCLLCK